MGNHLVKFKRALALVLAFVMTVSVLTVAPSTEVSAASSKYVSTLKVSSSKFTLTSGKKKTIKATVKTKGSSVSKKVTASLSAADKKEVSVKVGKPSKSGVTNITIKAKTVTSKKTAKVKVTTVGKSKNNKKIVKTVTVTVKPAAAKTVAVTAVNAAIDPSSSIVVDGQAKITATVVPANATDKTLTYISSNPTVAAVTQDGVVIGMSAGTATITVKANNGVSTTINVVVTAVKVTKIDIPDTLEVGISGSEKLTYTVLPENATDKTIKWSSKDTSIATVDQEGNVTGVAAGVTEVYATSADGSVKDTCKVTVTEVNPDGITLVVTNPYADAKNGNTVLIGEDMVVRARVTKDGKPQGNKTVILSKKQEVNSGVNGAREDDFDIKGDTVQTTDANGYANFVIGAKYDGAKVIDANMIASYRLTAKEASSNMETEIVVSFAAIDVSGIDVLNDDVPDVIPNLVPSDSALTAGQPGEAKAFSLDGKSYSEFVYSQQVSSEGVDHRVHISRTAELVEPAQLEEEKRDKWEYKVTDGTSGPANVYYGIDSTTTVQVAEVPAGLKYITLNFDKINLSKYEEMHVSIINKSNGSEIKVATYTDVNNTSILNNGIQIDKKYLDEYSSYKIVVYLETPGQVNAANEGYILTNLVGEWADTSAISGVRTAIPDAVEWTDVTDKVTYETSEISQAVAEELISKEYIKTGYTYYANIPVFPYVGNAIITVKDANKEVLAYFTCPVQNAKGTDGKEINKNVLPANSAYVVQVTEEEITNHAGVITEEGNKVIVDSTKTGKIALMGKLTVPGVDEKTLNDQNGGVLYTSVQWSPIPVADTESDKFFAIEDQMVDVIAQLYDRNGNTKSDQSKTITFTASLKDGETLAKGNKVNGSVYVEELITSTDAKGQAKLTLTGAEAASLNDIQATCTGYDVKLIVGDNKGVNKANIKWVDMGLGFQSELGTFKDEQDQIKDYWTKNLVATNVELSATQYTVAESWNIGFLPLGEYTDDNGAKLDVVRVDGITVDYNEQDVTAETTLTEKDNIATVTSKKAGTSKIEGNISNDFDSSKVVFTYKKANGTTATATNVGYGKVFLESTTLTLPIVWQADGININAFSTNGDKLAVVNGDATDTIVAITVQDNQGNPSTELVEIAVNGSDADLVESVQNILDNSAEIYSDGSKVFAPDKYGVVKLNLDGVDVNSVGKSATLTFTANVKNAKNKKVVKTITYTNVDNINTIFRVEKVEINTDKNVVVTFTEAINKDTILASQFKVKGSKDDVEYDIAYKVEKAEKGKNNTVILTLDKPADAAQYLIVTVGSGKNEDLGILSGYDLIDTYGRDIDDDDLVDVHYNPEQSNNNVTSATINLTGATVAQNADRNAFTIKLAPAYKTFTGNVRFDVTTSTGDYFVGTVVVEFKNGVATITTKNNISVPAGVGITFADDVSQPAELTVNGGPINYTVQ